MRPIVLVLLSPILAVADPVQEPPSEASRWLGLQFQLKAGWQTYLNHPAPTHPGSAGLRSFMIGYRWTPHMLVGASYGTAAYRILHSDGTSKDTQATSLLFFHRYHFRPNEDLQPFVDVGTGVVDPIPLYDTGKRGAFTVASGAFWKVYRRLGLTWNTRAVVWSQDGRKDDPQGFQVEETNDAITAVSSESTFALLYLW